MKMPFLLVPLTITHLLVFSWLHLLWESSTAYSVVDLHFLHLISLREAYSNQRQSLSLLLINLGNLSWRRSTIHFIFFQYKHRPANSGCSITVCYMKKTWGRKFNLLKGIKISTLASLVCIIINDMFALIHGLDSKQNTIWWNVLKIIFRLILVTLIQRKKIAFTWKYYVSNTQK